VTREQAPQEDAKTRTAAAFFAGFLALALGGAGVVIAMLAVGVERAWNGGETERGRSRERGQGWLNGQRAWLDADHRQRTARADAHRRWLQSGGDPATEPTKPSWAKRAGSAVRRLFANVAVAASDFVSGARDGARAANEARKNGSGFREVAGTRPHTCEVCQRPRVPVVADGMCADCAARAQEQWQRPEPDEAPTPAVPVHTGTVAVPPPATTGDSPAGRRRPSPKPRPRYDQDEIAEQVDYGMPLPPGETQPIGHWARCSVCGQGWQNFSTPALADAWVNRHWLRKHHTTPDPAPNGGSWCFDCPWCDHWTTAETEQQAQAKASQHKAQCPNRPNEGESMPENPTPTPQATPAAESNVTVLRADLERIRNTLTKMASLTDDLSQERSILGQQVREANEMANATGQAAQTRQALDEADALAASMGERIGDFSQGAVSAEEQVGQASDGLRVAEQAEDALRSSGADGRAVAPANA
jgi:hypothetical protein